MSTETDDERGIDVERLARELSEASVEAIIPVLERYLEEREAQEPVPAEPDRDAIREVVLEVVDELGLAEGSGGITREEAIEIAQEYGSDEGGVSREEAIEIAQEYGSGEGGLTREEAIEIAQEYGGLDPETEARLDAALARTEAALGDLENRMSRRVGPETPTGDYHTNPGWGLHFTAERPYRIGTATVEALTSGTVNVEILEYDGDAYELVDETEVRIPRGGEPVEIDLDLEVPEGEFLLTRDWENAPPQDDRVSLRRSENYGGWETDSGDGLIFHGAGHHEFSDNLNWYYFFNMGVRPQRTGGT